jgi:hypothetical protein
MHRVFAVVVTARAVDVRAPVVHENIAAKTMRSIASVRRRMCGGECGGLMRIMISSLRFCLL